MDVPREKFGDTRRRRRPGSRGAAAILGLLLAACTAMAQMGVFGSLEGRLTDLHSRPLGATTVILRNSVTGAALQTVTTKDGSYRFEQLAAGSYALEVENSRREAGQIQGISIVAGYVMHVRTAVELARQSELAVSRPATEAPAAPAQPSPTSDPGNASADLEPRFLPTIPPSGLGMAALSADAAAPDLPGIVPDAARIAHEGAILAAVASGAARSFAAIPASSSAQMEALRHDLGPAQPMLTTTISGEQLQSLPLAGRRWQEFALDTPAPSTVTQDEQAIPGGTRATEAISLEGATTKLAFGGRGIGSSLMSAGGSGAAIEELELAEPTGVTDTADERANVTMRSGAGLGTGRMHGQAFLYDKQNLWGARNPFTQWLKETAPASGTSIPQFAAEPWSPGDRRMTFGLGAGGVLLRSRVFWFGAVDGDLRNNPAVSTVRHPENFFAQPSNDEMQVLAARLALSSVNPVGEGLAAYSPMLETLDSLLGPAPRTSKQWNLFGRLDWHAAERHHFTMEATGARWDAPGGGLTRASETYGNHSFGSGRASETWVLGRWEAFLTPNLLSVAQGSMGRQILDRPAETPSAFEQSLNASIWGVLPQMVVDSRYGFTIGDPSRFGPGNYPDEHLYEAQEGLDWVRGSLLVRGGFELRHNADATSLLRNHGGTYHYAHLSNFVSDALAFEKFGLSGALDPANPHNCDQRGKAWRDSSGGLHGLGNLPCESYYTQTLGPTEWHLETDDWAGFATAQWQPARRFVLSAGLRWEHEDMPPPIALVNNPDLPLTQKLPSLGNEWGPRASLAWGVRESRWPIFQLGYGMYFGRTPNSVLETALTQTGSPKGDLNLFVRPMDGFTPFSGTSSAPIFPYVLQGDPATIEKPGAVELSPSFRNGEVHQAIAAIEEHLPGRIVVSAAATASLARRLPITVDTNVDPAVNPKSITYNVKDASGKGPIQSPQITVPFYATWPSATGATGRQYPNYQQISEILSRANSTYEAATLRISRYGQRGLSFHARYAYAHAMDWNPNEGALVSGPSVLDPNDFHEEYGTSNLDVRHSFSAMMLWDTPWKMHGAAGIFTNGWMFSAIGQFHSGLPYTMRTAGSIPEEFTASGDVIVGLGPGMNGYGGDDRVYGVGRNTFRYPATWKADVRVGKRFRLTREHEFELTAESFNLFNHQNVTELETIGYSIEPGTSSGSLPSLNFLTGLKTGQTQFGQPLNVNATDFYRERQIDFGARFRF